MGKTPFTDNGGPAHAAAPRAGHYDRRRRAAARQETTGGGVNLAAPPKKPAAPKKTPRQRKKLSDTPQIVRLAKKILLTTPKDVCKYAPPRAGQNDRRRARAPVIMAVRRAGPPLISRAPQLSLFKTFII